MLCRSSLGRVGRRCSALIALGCAFCLPWPSLAQTPEPTVAPSVAPAVAPTVAPTPPAEPLPATPPTSPAAPPAAAPALPPEPAAAQAPAPLAAAAPPRADDASDSDAKDDDAKDGDAKQGRAGSSDEESVGSGLRLGARLMLGFEHESEHSAGAQSPSDSSDYGFEIRQIRLSASGDFARLFRVNVSFDLADALDPQLGTDYDTTPYLRTASVEYRPSRAFRLRVGRFKRPLSHLELTSASDLPILRRGLFNGLALEDNQWGDRAVGAMASGRIASPKLRWSLGVMNPAWVANQNLRRKGVDVIGRVEWTLLKGVVLGANAAYKNIENGAEHVDAFAYGGDLAWKIGAAHLLLESNSAPSVITDPEARPRALGVLFLADYELSLGADWGLQPTVFAEYADADTSVYENESLRLVFGVNLLAYDGFRIMPQVDLVRSLGDTGADNPWRESTTLSLIFSIVL